jgi:hypothetical protein
VQVGGAQVEQIPFLPGVVATAKGGFEKELGVLAAGAYTFKVQCFAQGAQVTLLNGPTLPATLSAWAT